jgi:Anti-sigma factor NepR
MQGPALLLQCAQTPPRRNLPVLKTDGEGNRTTIETGKRRAIIPDSSLSDNLSSDPKLDRTIQTRIGDQLRAMYDDLVQQPVPDRFADLLARLERTQAERGE